MLLFQKLAFWLLSLIVRLLAFTKTHTLRPTDPSKSANTPKRLEGQVAIVMGGASGTGASTARLFSEHGANVVVADIGDDLGNSRDEVGSGVSFRYCDASVEDDVRALVDATLAEHGRLDIMYVDNNNAGILDSSLQGATILDSAGHDLTRVAGANLRRAFYGAKHAVRAMRRGKRGCILFTASTCGSAAHVMSKYGVFGLVKNLSAEVGKHGIRVNCISASSGDADANNAEEWAPRDESVARAALYLASGDASYVSGHNLVLDGVHIFNAVVPNPMRNYKNK